jgi:hypothetical protein
MAVARADRKDINSLIILMARSSWIEETVRFFFFFDKFASMPREVCRRTRAEFELWKIARLCGRLGDITHSP